MGDRGSVSPGGALHFTSGPRCDWILVVRGCLCRVARCVADDLAASADWFGTGRGDGRRVRLGHCSRG